MDYDYIVVGGGSAGCVTASRLVADFGAKVLLLEAGFPDRHPLIRMPSGFVRMLRDPDRFMVGYESVPQPALGGRTVTVLQANVFGGGSSVNAMTYTRGTCSDYDRWDKSVGGVGWGWSDILPHFIRQEGNQRLGAPLHGVDGPLKVSDAHHPPTDISRAFLVTLQEMGLPFTPDVNCGDERGATYIQSTTYRGTRCSAAKAFIEPCAQDKRLTVKFNSAALRIVIQRGRAIGVEYADSAGRKFVAMASREIILTAGAFITPKLLMLSGIGPAEELRKHGIHVLVDLSGVGQNMQDHNDASLIIETKYNYGYSGEDRGLRMLINGLQYLLFNSGPVTSTGSEVTAFLNPECPGSDPIIQLYCVPKILPVPGCGPASEPGATLIANLIAPLTLPVTTLALGVVAPPIAALLVLRSRRPHAHAAPLRRTLPAAVALATVTIRTQAKPAPASLTTHRPKPYHSRDRIRGAGAYQPWHRLPIPYQRRATPPCHAKKKTAKRKIGDDSSRKSARTMS